MAEHSLPTPHFFRLTYDVSVENFNGPVYGFEPYSTSMYISLGGRRVDGLGAAVLANGQIGFLGYDIDNNSWVVFNAQPFNGTVRALGIEWAPGHIQLIVNGDVVQTINVNFGSGESSGSSTIA